MENEIELRLAAREELHARRERMHYLQQESDELRMRLQSAQDHAHLMDMS